MPLDKFVGHFDFNSDSDYTSALRPAVISRTSGLLTVRCVLSFFLVILFEHIG